MNSRYYYAFDDDMPVRGISSCSRASDELPLIVNCAGNTVTPFPFSTDNASGREDYYLLYMASGSMRLQFPDGEHRIGPGDAVLFPPRYHYQYAYEGESEGEAVLSYLWVHFTGSYADKFLAELGFGALPCLHVTGRNDGTVSAFRRIFDVFEAKSHLQRYELAAALESLLLAVASSLVPDGAGRTLERSVRYIHAAYNTDIRIPELAEMESLSNSRYIALFVRQMGVPPSTYIIRLRMSAACDLLHATDMSVKQIGALVGYEDVHFFSRTFKKQVGVSPQSYRNGAVSAAKN